jgi:hypothetical protein
MRAVFGNPLIGVGVANGSFVANGEFVAALGAPARKDGAAIFRGHANPESMCLCPFAVIRLKGAFWHLISSARAARRNVEDVTFSIGAGDWAVKLEFTARGAPAPGRRSARPAWRSSLGIGLGAADGIDGRR